MTLSPALRMVLSTTLRPAAAPTHIMMCSAPISLKYPSSFRERATASLTHGKPRFGIYRCIPARCWIKPDTASTNSSGGSTTGFPMLRSATFISPWAFLSSIPSSKSFRILEAFLISLSIRLDRGIQVSWANFQTPGASRISTLKLLPSLGKPEKMAMKDMVRCASSTMSFGLLGWRISSPVRNLGESFSNSSRVKTFPP